MKPFTNSLWFFLFLAFLSQYSLAQQLPLFVNNRDNAFLANPAMAVVPYQIERQQIPKNRYRPNLMASFSGRMQWLSFKENKPQFGTAKIQYRLHVDGVSFLWGGFHGFFDQTGPNSLSGAGLSSSFHLGIRDGEYIQAGLSLTWLQQKLNTNNLSPLVANDLTLINYQQRPAVISPGLGVFYSSPILYGGFSIPYGVVNIDNDKRILGRQLYGVIGGFIKSKSSNRKPGFHSIEPSLWIKVVDKFPTLLDGNVKLRYWLNNESMGWIGVGYYTYLDSDSPVSLGIGSSNATRFEIGFITDSGAGAITAPPFFKFGFAYIIQQSQSSSLGSTLEATISIMGKSK